MGFKTLYSSGTDYEVIGLVGNTATIDVEQVVQIGKHKVGARNM